MGQTPPFRTHDCQLVGTRNDTNVDTNAHSNGSRNSLHSRVAVWILYSGKLDPYCTLWLTPLTSCCEFHLYYDI